MIKEIAIKNFYGFKDTTIKIHPETNILIGINGSGKSNFLKVLRLLKESVAGVGLSKHIMENLGGFDNIFFKGQLEKDAAQSITIKYTFDAAMLTKYAYGSKFKLTDDPIYQITITKSPSSDNFYISEEKCISDKGFIYLSIANGNGVISEKKEGSKKTNLERKYTGLNPQELVLKSISETQKEQYDVLYIIKKSIEDIVVYDYFDTTPKSAIRKPMLSTSDKRLSYDGTNLPQIINTLKINDKSAYKKIVAMLQEVNPNFSDFDFNLIGGNIELMLSEDDLNSAIHVSNISDGTLRYLCLLAILYNPQGGKFICIDEPEVGMHPDMIFNITEAIKDASEHSTVVVSTHSENLLNYFKIEHLRVFEKIGGNATAVLSYTEEQFSSWYENFALGNMWKQGDFGGLRYGN
jgi:predicted ATPase